MDNREGEIRWLFVRNAVEPHVIGYNQNTKGPSENH